MRVNVTAVVNAVTFEQFADTTMSTVEVVKSWAPSLFYVKNNECYYE